MKRTGIALVGGAALLAVAGSMSPTPASGATAGPRYAVVDLGALSAGYSEAYAISDGSPVAVAGHSARKDDPHRFFVWTEATGMVDSGPGDASRYGIDDDNRVVGTSGWYPFSWTAAGVQSLAMIGEGRGTANAVSATGGIVGSYLLADGAQHAYRLADGGTTDLGTLGGMHSDARGVSSVGVVVGTAGVPGGASHAFLWVDEAGGMSDLGTLGPCCGRPAESAATGASDRGVVVGQTSSAALGTTRAFVWEGPVKGMRDLGQPYWRKGTMSTFATGVNDAGQIVGWGYPATNRALLWQGETAYDLTSLIPKTSGWVLQRAEAINDAGWIVGWGTIRGARHGFLLKPV